MMLFLTLIVKQTTRGVCQDQELSAGTDGSYLGERHFRCPPNKGLFVKLRNCRRDSRFPAPETPVNQVERCNSIGRKTHQPENSEPRCVVVTFDPVSCCSQPLQSGAASAWTSTRLRWTARRPASCTRAGREASRATSTPATWTPRCSGNS